CLGRYYEVAPELPADLGERAFEERLDHPALADMLLQPYRPGAIRPVTTPDEDPGRVRVDALFVATYPKRDVLRVDFLGRRLVVHKKVAAAFARVAERLRAARDK